MTALKQALFMLVLVAITAPFAHAQSGITNMQGRKVTCASDDGRRHYCGVDTSRGVRLVNQRSGSPCVQGSTWGSDRRGIWVDRGCRADFIVGSGYNNGGNNGYPPSRPGPGGYPPGTYPPGGMVTCSSNNGRRNFCNFDTRRGVRLVNQRSGSPCVQGSTWGYNSKGVWVDRGCRADFSSGR